MPYKNINLRKLFNKNYWKKNKKRLIESNKDYYINNKNNILNFTYDKYYKRKEKYIILLGGKCINCNENDFAKLEFDHIDPKTKSFGICKHLFDSENKILKELEKCQLLCKKCHKIKTQQYMSLIKNGEDNIKSKLDNKQVLEIMNLLENNKIQQKDVAEKYGVSRIIITNIFTGRNWSKITGRYFIPYNYFTPFISDGVTPYDIFKNNNKDNYIFDNTQGVTIYDI